MAKYCPYCVSKIERGDSCPFCNYSYFYEVGEQQLRPGTLLKNKYLIGRVLGQGGFGITYIGRDLTLDMKVAIKEYYPSNMVTRSNSVSSAVSLMDWSFASNFKKGKEQFIQEAQTIAKMDKESAVVTVRDFFEENGSAYIVMEFVEGTDLKSMMEKQRKPLDSKYLLPLLEPIFSALGELHDIGLIHRDISPDNIMLENSRVRLIDFGGAGEALRVMAEEDTLLKHSFSPPEQYENSGMGPWTDVYAMGATIYYCLTGKLPPRATDRIVKDRLEPPSGLGAKLTAKQERAILKALSLKKEDRFQSMADFGKDLFVHRKKAGWAAVAAVLALIAIGGGVYIYRMPEKEAQVIREELPVVNTFEEILPIDDERVSAADRETLRTLMNTVQESSLNLEERNDSYGDYFVLPLRNETEDMLENVRFYVRFYDTDGAIVDEAQNSTIDWRAGQALISRFYCLNYNYADGKIPLGGAAVRIQMESDNGWVKSEYVPVPVEGQISPEEAEAENTEDRQTTGGQKVVFRDELPKTLTSRNGAVIRIDELKKAGSGTVIVKGTFVSGKFSSSDDIAYKFRDAEGTVYQASTVYFGLLHPGEQFEETVSVPGGINGELYFELYDGN